MKPIRLTPAQAVFAASWSIARLDTFGISVPPRSRLPNARDALEKFLKLSVEELSAADVLARLFEAYRTILEIFCLVSAIETPNDSLITIARKAIVGPDLPSPQGEDAPRNYQFEGLIAALIRHARITDVTSAEPDIRIAAGNRFIAVAAKRVTSDRRDQLRKNAVKALKQLTRQREMGFIVLSLDSLVTRALARGRKDPSQVLGNAVNDISTDLKRRDREDLVAGVYGFATILGLSTSTTPPSMSIDVCCHLALHVGPDDPDGVQRFLGERGAALARSFDGLANQLLIASNG